MREFAISPAEREPFTKLGQVSLGLTEKYGVDFAWMTPAGLVGAQRKATMDLLASVRPAPGQEPRLGKELVQMKALAAAFVIIEGTFAWTADGQLNSPHVNWTQKMQWGVEMSIQAQGYTVLKTRTPMETVTILEYLYDKTQEKEHTSSLLARGKPPTNGWGKSDDRSTFVHIFSSLPGVSTEMSGRIFDRLGNVLSITATDDELLSVDGIGKKRVKLMRDALPGGDS